MRIAVLGSAGGMGSFFARYLVSRGNTVVGYDVKKTRVEGVEVASSLKQAVRGAEVVIIATPIDGTAAVAARAVPEMNRGSLLVEICSVKEKVLPRLREIARGRARLLSIHPLFGPSLSSPAAMKVGVLGRSRGREMEEARILLPDARLIAMKEEEHDRLMGLVLSMTHLVNLAYAGAVARYISPERFREIATPTSWLQLNLAEVVLSQDPRLCSHIQMENPYSAELADAMVEELDALRSMIARRDRKDFERRLSSISKTFRAEDPSKVMNTVYGAFEASEEG